MFTKKLEYPILCEIAGRSYHVANGYCRIEIDADETTGFADWYVRDIEIDTTHDQSTIKWKSLPKDHPEFARIQKLVLNDWRSVFDEAFAEWQMDMPRNVRRKLEKL